MSILTIGSLLSGFIVIILAFIVDGGNPAKLLSPTAALIVLGGTFLTLFSSTAEQDLKRFPKILKVAISKPVTNYDEIIAFFKKMANKVRKEGILCLESASNEIDDEFIKKGFQYVADGIDSDNIRSIMEEEAYAVQERHKIGYGMFEAMGGFAPTMGIIGTVMGLVQVLSNLNDPNSLGGKIAGAFIATLYGIGSANLIWLPIANKLKALDAKEMKKKELIIEAVLSIQKGINPNIIEEKLYSILAQDKKE